MISLNTPIGTDGTGELLDLYGVEDTTADAVDAADAVARSLSRLRPVARALVVAVHTGELSIDDAAARLGKSPLAVTRLLRAAERTARGRTRSAGTPAPGAGVELPVGTVRARKNQGNRVRFIKVRMDGPAAKRWAPYARWVWEQRHGPAPAGKFVIHEDGDTLNDDPGNLVLGGHADRAFLFQARSEANFGRSMAACHAGAARHNRERAAARDLAGEVRACMWYAVDHDARTVTGPVARRSIAEAYTALGVSPPAAGAANSPRPWVAAQLGWPRLSCGEASVLAALATRPDHSWTRVELTAAVEALAARIGRPMRLGDSYLDQFLCRARRRGFVTTTRRGTLGSVHRIAPAAIDARGNPCLLAVLRGRDCGAFKCEGYAVRPLTTAGGAA